mmetsp:Transcript_32517/g.76568  ORF Transcript_32517/g.76568 Transcript_32517/m.76568 type:complete len:174 (+) Transcript_32517:2415-2936(+)
MAGNAGHRCSLVSKSEVIYKTLFEAKVTAAFYSNQGIPLSIAPAVHPPRLVLHEEADHNAGRGQEHNHDVRRLKTLDSVTGDPVVLARSVVVVVVVDVFFVHLLRDHLGQQKGPGRGGKAVVKHVIRSNVCRAEEFTDAEDHEWPAHAKGETAERDADDERHLIRCHRQYRVR